MGLLSEALGFISKPVTQYIKNRGDIKKAEHSRDLAIINNQARLAETKESHNHQWEMESLKGNSKALRFMCFVQFAIPLNIAVIFPEAGAEIWNNLDDVPAWFVQAYVIIVGSIWGISEFKSAAPQVIGAIMSRGQTVGKIDTAIERQNAK